MENEKIIEDEKKVNLGFKVRPSFRAALTKQAQREKRSLGNVSEVLLEWAYDQLQRSGDTIVDLIENWEARPAVSKKGKAHG